MAPEIINNLDKIIATCKKMQVQSLYVVGSAARSTDYKPESDIDFLYTMISNKEGLPKEEYDYFDLLFTLESITGRKIDLIAEKGIRNKYLLKSLLEDRQKIYEA
jgi:uncharacterized protein